MYGGVGGEESRGSPLSRFQAKRLVSPIGNRESFALAHLWFIAWLGSVWIHREFITAAARWIIAAKLWSVLSARSAMRLNSLSLPKKFSIK